MHRDLASEHRWWPVSRVVVPERTDSPETRSERSEPGPRSPWVLVVAASDGESDAVALRHDEASRPDFDVELVDLARRQGLHFVVRVVRPVRQRERRVELAMRGAQPSLRNGRVRIERALEGDFLQVGAEDAKDEEQVGVRGTRGDEELRGDGAGDLGLGGERRSEEGDASA